MQLRISAAAGRCRSGYADAVEVARRGAVGCWSTPFGGVVAEQALPCLPGAPPDAAGSVAAAVYQRRISRFFIDETISSTSLVYCSSTWCNVAGLKPRRGSTSVAEEDLRRLTQISSLPRCRPRRRRHRRTANSCRIVSKAVDSGRNDSRPTNPTRSPFSRRSACHTLRPAAAMSSGDRPVRRMKILPPDGRHGPTANRLSTMPTPTASTGERHGSRVGRGSRIGRPRRPDNRAVGASLRISRGEPKPTSDTYILFKMHGLDATTEYAEESRS